MGLRRIARECALQMLYEREVGKYECGDVLASFWAANHQPERVQEFANELFQGSVARLAEIDAIIQKHAENWRIPRMAVVDRNILRLAVFEFVSAGRTPQTVVINEALEIAKKYSTVESAQFVNGILDSIKNDLLKRPAEEKV